MWSPSHGKYQEESAQTWTNVFAEEWYIMEENTDKKTENNGAGSLVKAIRLSTNNIIYVLLGIVVMMTFHMCQISSGLRDINSSIIGIKHYAAQASNDRGNPTFTSYNSHQLKDIAGSLSKISEAMYGMGSYGAPSSIGDTLRYISGDLDNLSLLGSIEDDLNDVVKELGRLRRTCRPKQKLDAQSKLPNSWPKDASDLIPGSPE